jgi:hypothetical protein
VFRVRRLPLGPHRQDRLLPGRGGCRGHLLPVTCPGPRPASTSRSAA